MIAVQAEYTFYDLECVNFFDHTAYVNEVICIETGAVKYMLYTPCMLVKASAIQ